MRSFGSIIAVLLAAGAARIMAAEAPSNATTAQQELEQLRRPDALNYADHLYEDDKKWGYVSGRIATGQSDWLRVAGLLKLQSGAAPSEELNSSLGTALATQPGNVLRFLKQGQKATGFRLQIVCHAPFPTPGKSWLTRYKARAIKSVKEVRDPKLLAIRDACLRNLRSVDLTKPPEAYE